MAAASLILSVCTANRPAFAAAWAAARLPLLVDDGGVRPVRRADHPQVLEVEC
ncbi:MAG: hypothetical protein J6T01_05215 [Kiritimatiellae bacterium]|nr:hypothetical protein [Kiritimatiellia bacterium]